MTHHRQLACCALPTQTTRQRESERHAARVIGTLQLPPLHDAQMAASSTGSRLSHPAFALTSRRRRVSGINFRRTNGSLTHTLGGIPDAQVRPTLTEEQKAEVKEAFDLFDSEHTGKIDYYELKVRWSWR